MHLGVQTAAQKKPPQQCEVSLEFVFDILSHFIDHIIKKIEEFTEQKLFTY